MSEINWCGYKWLTNERWGQVHPDKTLSWSDPSAVEINKDGYLVLKTHKNRKVFGDVVSEIGIGLVSNKTEFDHGYFEIEAKLPTGKNLWASFWMWSYQTWPPEIDVFEAVSGKNTKGYFKIFTKQFWGFWNLQTNVHYGHTEDGTKNNIEPKTHFMGFKNPRKHFIKYGCFWAPDRIDFFYNGYKVRTITDEKILKYFEGHKMNLIINNRTNDDLVDVKNPTESEMIIKYFKYTPL